MSRSYRIKVRETLRRLIRAEDHVSSQLELLDILPPEQMSELLAEQLVRAGFKRTGNKATRTEKEIAVVVDLNSGEVTVAAEAKQNVALESGREGHAFDDMGPSAKEVRERLRKDLRASLEKQVGEQASQLQQQVTDKLEGTLADVKLDLDRAVNRATAAALKLKASQMGQIKTMTEDPASGSLTIVVEV